MLDARHRGIYVAIDQGDAELFASKPSDDCIGSECLFQFNTDAFEYAVADKMAVYIVDLLEQIDIGDDQRERRGTLARAKKVLLRKLEETGVVVQAGQPVAL